MEIKKNSIIHSVQIQYFYTVSNSLHLVFTEDNKNSIISLCKQNKLIAILEVHDCTGYPEQSGSVQLSTAVDYWIEMKSVLVGQEDYVIINIANEPFGNNVVATTWLNEHKTAISRLRTNGFEHALMIDVANWGRTGNLSNCSTYSKVCIKLRY